jgi:hypothetical protein
MSKMIKIVLFFFRNVNNNNKKQISQTDDS